MTEAEWLACTEPLPMLEFLKGKASDRKLRLFACGCCRLVWDSLTFRRSTQAVETAEEFADGLADEHDLLIAGSRAGQAAADFQEQSSRRKLINRDVTDQECRLFLARESTHSYKPFLIGRLQWVHRDNVLRWSSPRLLFCLFGNPFRPVALAPAWRTSTVTALAQAAYEERILPAGTLDPDRLAVLADALEDVGCDNDDILSHLRGPGPHYRGCWAVDLLLARE